MKKRLYSKSIMAHRIYNFFHCYHGGLICFFVLLLLFSGVFVSVNPFDIAWINIGKQMIKNLNESLKDFGFLSYIAPHFKVFSEGLRWFESCFIAVFILSCVMSIFFIFMKRKGKFFLIISISFYIFSIFLLCNLKTTKGNFFEGLIVLWILAAAIFMLILNFVFGGDFDEGLLRLFICGIVAVIGGIAVAVLAAFPFMMGDEPNVPLYIKCACGGVMFVIAFFHFDIMLNLFDLLPAPLDKTGDPIIDMIGTEYESIADIDDM